MKDGLDDVAVRARQNLPEYGARDLDIEGLALGAVQPRGLEQVVNVLMLTGTSRVPGICPKG